MKERKYSNHVVIAVFFVFFMVVGCVANESWAVEGKYPNKPIQIVIPFQPGSTDMAFRPFTEKLPEYLRQPLTFVYKPGAAGATGASFVAKAKPDGYTIIGGPQSPFITSPLTMEGLDYTLDDFVPVCRLVSGPLVIAVKTDSPWKTIKDVVEEAKRSPGKLTYSTPGVFTSQHIAMEMFAKAAGVSVTHVPCTGGNPAATAVLGGHVSMTSSTMTPVAPHIKSGTMRIIGVFEKEKLKEYPDVPTFSESGYPVVLSMWYGFLAPKGTPEEVIRTIYTACKNLIENHKSFVEDRLENLSLKLGFLSPDEFAKEIKAEYEVRKRIVKELMKPTK